MDEAENERIAQLLKLVENHPSTSAQTEWNLLRRVYNAYLRNANDLIALIASPHDDPRLALDIMAEDQSSGARDTYYDELFRFLLNYLAAVSTLVDHSRNLMKGYTNSRFHFDYQHRIALLTNLEVVGFVQDLRNYLLRHRFPPLSINLHISNEPNDIAFTVTLNCNRLLRWNGWKSKAKHYMRGKDSIVLRQSVEDYSSAINELYGWLFTQFQIVHAQDLLDVERLRAEARELLGLPDDWKGVTHEPQ